MGDDALLPIRYEEYRYSVLFGWSFHGYGLVHLPNHLLMEEVYEVFKNQVDVLNDYEHISLTVCTSSLIHFNDTCLLPLCSSCCCCCCRLCLTLCCPFLFEKKGLSLTNGRSEISGTVRDVFLYQGAYLRYYRPRFMRGQHDIGIWTSKSDFLGSNLLLSSNYSTLTSKNFQFLSMNFKDIYIDQTSSISKLISYYNGNDHAVYHINHCPIEIFQNLQILQNIVEESYQKTLSLKPSAKYEDFKHYMTLSDLIMTIGKETTFQLLHYFIYETFTNHQSSNNNFNLLLLQSKNSRHINQIILRRTSLDSQCIPFHTDYALRTMQIMLNSSNEYHGGELVYLTNNQYIIPKRDIGTILIHENDIVHGVTEMMGGIRYGLFLLQKKVEENSITR